MINGKKAGYWGSGIPVIFGIGSFVQSAAAQGGIINAVVASPGAERFERIALPDS